MAISMSASNAVLAQAAEVLSQAVDGTGEPISRADVQAILSAAVCAYAAQVERQGKFPAFSPQAATATEVAVAACAMLEAVNIGIFELSMWQSLKGSPAAT